MIKIIKSLYFHAYPNFLVKESIRKSIEMILKDYKDDFKYKKSLDIGCGSKPYAQIFKKNNIEYEGIDFDDYTKYYPSDLDRPNYIFNKFYTQKFLCPEFEDKSYDIITAFEVLEHHEKPEVFFAESYRILRENGFLLISFPFIWNLHEEPADYQRFTHYMIEKYASRTGFSVIEIIKRGNTLSTIVQILQLSIIDCRFRIARIVLFLLMIPIQWSCYLFNPRLMNKKGKLFLGYTILLKKSQNKLYDSLSD